MAVMRSKFKNPLLDMIWRASKTGSDITSDDERERNALLKKGADELREESLFGRGAGKSVLTGEYAAKEFERLSKLKADTVYDARTDTHRSVSTGRVIVGDDLAAIKGKGHTWISHDELGAFDKVPDEIWDGGKAGSWSTKTTTTTGATLSAEKLKREIEKALPMAESTIGSEMTASRKRAINKALSIIKDRAGPSAIDAPSTVADDFERLGNALTRCPLGVVSAEHGRAWALAWDHEYNQALAIALENRLTLEAAATAEGLAVPNPEDIDAVVERLERTLTPKSEHSPESELESALAREELEQDPDFGSW